MTLLHCDLLTPERCDSKVNTHQTRRERRVPTSLLHSYLRVQEDDPLLGDKEIDPGALVSSSFFDFLALSSENITPVQASMHDTTYKMLILILHHSK